MLRTQQARWARRMSKVMLGGTLAVVGAGACGGPSTQQVSDARIPFMFAAPASFEVAHVTYTVTQPAILVQADATPGDDFDHLDIRRTAAPAVPMARMLLDLKGRPGPPPRTEMHSGLATATAAFDFVDGKQPVHDSVYLFAAADSTWELECEATTSHRSAIEKACNEAMNSIQLGRHG